MKLQDCNWTGGHSQHMTEVHLKYFSNIYDIWVTFLSYCVDTEQKEACTRYAVLRQVKDPGNPRINYIYQ